MRLAIIAIAACLLIPATGLATGLATRLAAAATEPRAGLATDFSAAKKKMAVRKASKKPRAKSEQYMRAVPAK